MNEVIMKLRKCAEELAAIADMLAKGIAKDSGKVSPEATERLDEDAKRIVDALSVFGVAAQVVKLHQGPTVNQVELALPISCHYDSVTNLAGELQAALGCRSLRIEAPLPGSDKVGVEYERRDPELVTFADTVRPEIARLDALRERPYLPVVFGRDVNYESVSFDLTELPHLLVGGECDRDKSMLLNNLICGLVSVRSPEELMLIVFDPHLNELGRYDGLPHLVVPVIHENRRMFFALHWAVCELEKRLEIFARAKVRNIKEYNAREVNAEDSADDLPKTLPYVVIVLGEIAELVTECKDDVILEISRLTQKAHAAGIHLVLATHCVESQVVSGTIKANIPGRIALKMATPQASCVILDEEGAECLTGKGDALYIDQDGGLCRVQTPVISEADIKNIVSRCSDNCIPLESDFGQAMKTDVE